MSFPRILPVMALTMLVGAESALAADIRVQTVHTQVTTKGTRLNGARRSSTSDWTTLTAPKGYVISEHATEVHETSAAGSGNRVDVEYDDWVEVLPGIKQPRTVRVRSHARSPRHKHGARGWTKANVVVSMVEYK